MTDFKALVRGVVDEAHKHGAGEVNRCATAEGDLLDAVLVFADDDAAFLRRIAEHFGEGKRRKRVLAIADSIERVTQ